MKSVLRNSTSAKLVMGVALLVVSCWSSAAEEGKQLSWSGVLDAEHRQAGNSDRDRYRHPLKTLTFFGLQPCDTVVELWPGGGWYTEILAPVLKDCGKLYTAHFATDSKVAFFTKSRAKFDQKVSANPEVYGKVEVTTLQAPGSVAIAPPESADKVLTFRNVHNWLKADSAEAVFKAAFDALKPGGILGVVEHRASPGTSLKDMKSSGYVTEDQVIALAESAGFLLLDRSDINANPADKHDYPAGVWTLPPSLRLGEKDKDKYLEIGESDRMTLKFGKPVYE